MLRANKLYWRAFYVKWYSLVCIEKQHELVSIVGGRNLTYDALNCLDDHPENESHADVAACCHLSRHTCNRSLFPCGLSIDYRAYVISQHARSPIRTLRPTCTNQDVWVVITPKRPKANSIHTATRHAWTRTRPRNVVQKAVFSLIHFLASLIRLWPLCHFDWGDESRHKWGLFLVEETVSLHRHQL